MKYKKRFTISFFIVVLYYTKAGKGYGRDQGVHRGGGAMGLPPWERRRQFKTPVQIPVYAPGRNEMDWGPTLKFFNSSFSEVEINQTLLIFHHMLCANVLYIHYSLFDFVYYRKIYAKIMYKYVCKYLLKFMYCVLQYYTLLRMCTSVLHCMYC